MKTNVWPFGYLMAILYHRPRYKHIEGYMGWAKSLFNTTLAISNLRAHNVAAHLEAALNTGSSLLTLFFETLEKQPCKQKTM